MMIKHAYNYMGLEGCHQTGQEIVGRKSSLFIEYISSFKIYSQLARGTSLTNACRISSKELFREISTRALESHKLPTTYGSLIWG